MHFNSAIPYWISIFIGEMSMSISFMLSIFSKEIPTISNLTKPTFAGHVFMALSIINVPFLLYVIYSTFVFFKKSISLVENKSSKLFHFLLVLFTISSLVFIIPGVAIFYWTPERSESIHYTLLVVYAISGICSSYAADYTFAVSSGLMIKISLNLNLAEIITFIISLCTVIITVKFNVQIKLFGIICAFAQMILFSFFYCNIMFLGIISQGAKFLPVQPDIFKREKQTILPNSLDIV